MLAMFVKLSLLFCLLQLPINTNGAVLTATSKLEDLSIIERVLIDFLDLYLTSKDVDEPPEVLVKFSREVRQVYNGSQLWEKPQLVTPPQIFALIRRFVNNWATVGQYIKGNYTRVWFKKFDMYKAYFPTMNEDLHGCISGMFMLQDTYNITAKQMASGKIPGSNTAFEISADDCFLLASTALQYNRAHRARDWINEALERTRHPSYQGNLDLGTVLQYGSWVEYVNGNLERAVELGVEYLNLHSEDTQMSENVLRYRREIQTGLVKTYEHIKAEEDKNLTEIFRNTILNRLCREESIAKLHNQEHLLKCRYIFSHPLLVLKPAKEETVLAKPVKIIIYRDFLTNKELEKIKDIAKPYLKRSVAYNLKTGILEEVPYRISENAWLDHRGSETLTRFNARAEAATGLAVDTAEYLQIANYGFGGQYEEHHDHGYPNSPLANHVNGNRLATLLLYLSEVPFGGGTAFTRLKTYVRPNKGDAVFWYNLNNSGVGNNITFHAACPVLTGVKWVGNKWFHTHGQEFRRPCLLNN